LVDPASGFRTAPKLPVDVAAASIDASHRDGCTAACMNASVKLPKSPKAAAIPSPASLYKFDIL
jgi:hypothetical protein